MPSVDVQGAFRVLAACTVCFFASAITDTPLAQLVVRTIRAKQAPGRDGVVTVRLTDKGGAPVRSAEVMAFWIKDNHAYLAGFHSSDKRGLTTFSSLPYGTLWFLANHKGFARASHRVRVGSRPSSVNIVLRPAHHLSVSVADSQRRPIANARAQVTCADPLPFVATTGATGEASCTRLCAPPYDVRVTAPGYGSWVRRLRTAPSSPLRVTLNRRGAITVRVVTEQGAPAPLSTVLLTGPGVWPARQTLTTAFGRTTIAGLPSGSYALRASRGELVSKVRGSVVVDQGKQVPITLTLQPGRMLTVQVVQGSEEKPAPVPAARVVVSEQGLSLFPNEASTGDQGTARLGPFLDKTPLTVTATAPGYFADGPVRVPASETTAVVRVTRGGKIAGDVVDERGFPVPGASIEVIGTDLSGQPVSLTPAMVAFQQAHFAWGLSGHPRLIPVGQLGVMPGPVPPIPHTNPWQTGAVTVPGGSKSNAVRAWVTGGHGKFIAGPVPPGQLGVIVRHPAYVQALSPTVTVGPGGVGHVHVVLYPGGTLLGVVLDDRRYPVEGALVRVVSADGTNERSTLSGPDGSFSFSALPGDLIVTAARPETTDKVAFEKHMAVKAGERQELEIVLPRAREAVTFRVLDDRGYPVDRAKIRVTSLASGVSLRRTTFTDKKGEAEVGDAAELDLKVEVRADGYATLTKSLKAVKGQVQLKLSLGCQVVGRVTARGGLDRVAGANVTVWLDTGQRVLTTGNDGTFRLHDLAPQSLRVRVDHDAYVQVERTFRIPKDQDPDRPLELPTIELQEAGFIEGKVVNDRGEPVVGAWVSRDKVPEVLPVGPLPPGVVVTDKEGKYRLPSLPEGQLTVEAYAPGVGRGKEEDIAVRARRETKQVQITLEKEKAGAGPAWVSTVAVQVADEAGGEVKVTEVVAGSLADRAGIRVGDIIERVDDKEPKTAAEARKLLRGPQRQDVLLRLKRGEKTLRVSVGRESVRGTGKR